jgi:hypothetical protein
LFQELGPRVGAAGLTGLDPHHLAEAGERLRTPFLPEGVLQGERQDGACLQAARQVPDAGLEADRPLPWVREPPLGGDPEARARLPEDGAPDVEKCGSAAPSPGLDAEEAEAREHAVVRQGVGLDGCEV